MKAQIVLESLPTYTQYVPLGVLGYCLTRTSFLSRTSKVLCTFQKGPYPLHLAHSVREVRCRVANSTGRGPIH